MTDATEHLATLSRDEVRRVAMLFDELFESLSEIGRDPDGGWTRLAWTDADRRARGWFEEQAARLGLRASVDRNGNQWAWTAEPRSDAVVTGSHLDTVRRGGRFDGALGVVCGLVAAHVLQRRGSHASIAVVAFADEEGGRWGTPMLGSRLLTGALLPASVLERRDKAGVSLREAMTRAGIDPDGLGRDDDTLERIGAFVEVHLEQGHILEGLDRPLGVATATRPHGRWRFELRGEANHAGTTELADRRDPTLVLAALITEGRNAARAHDALVTVGRVLVSPNSSNSVAAHVAAWLDVRAAREAQIDAILAIVTERVAAVAATHGIEVSVVMESRVPALVFSPALCEAVGATLAAVGLPTASLDTAAGHDAAALAAAVPATMLFVRNPTGISHSPAESARREDCLAAVTALVTVLDRLGGAAPWLKQP